MNLRLKTWFNPLFILLVILIVASVIRLWGLNNTPVSLYWDEMDVGYQAYSILNTGKDYFGNFLPLTPHSFADFRAPALIYLSIPFVALFDLTAFSVRLPAAIFGIISVLLIYFVSKEIFEDHKKALIASLILALSPWHIHFSRMSFEATIMLTFCLLGVYGFFRGLKDPKWYLVSSASFSLSMWTYNTAKLFIPLMVFILAVLFFKHLKFKKYLIAAVVFFILQTAILLFSNFFLGGGQRFSEISVFTDPQLASQVDFKRFESASSYSPTREVGLQTRFVDKLVYNRPFSVLDMLTSNFIQVFSTEFLFLSGDPNLRHSASIIGQFYRIEFLTFILGLVVLITNLRNKKLLFLGLWLITAPLPSIFTRDGGNHATRLFFLLPAMVLIISLGVGSLLKIPKWKIKSLAILGYFTLLLFQLTVFLNFYFGAYSWESAEFFQYGFSESVQKAIDKKDNYEYIVVDGGRDSALMNYLFVTKFDPKQFQNIKDNMKTSLDDMEVNKINNFYFLYPGSRNWFSYFERNKILKRYLLVVSASSLNDTTPTSVEEKLSDEQQLIDVIYYPDGIPAFYLIENNILSEE